MNQHSPWWTQIRSDPAKLNDWIVDQYHSYAIAANRVRETITLHLEEFDSHGREICNRISSDYERYSNMMTILMHNRSIGPSSAIEPTKFIWSEIPEPMTAEAAAAIMAKLTETHHDRLNAILMDEKTPSDVRSTVSYVFKNMLFHKQAFKTIAGTEYYTIKVPKNAELEHANLFL